MRVLITGANGFLGSHLVDHLLGKGVEVRALVRRTSNLRWIEGRPVELFYGDVSGEPGQLAGAVEGAQRVFHLAGLTKALDPRAFHEVNVKGTENLIRACLLRQTPPERFVLVSSCDAVGPSETDEPLTEERECRPVTEYGRSKLAAERMAARYEDELSIAILRPGAIYGPRDFELYPAFRLVQMGVAALLGIRKRRMNMAHVRDVARAVALAGSVANAGSQTFLMGGVNTDQGGLFEAIARALGKRFVLRFRVPGPLVRLAALASSGVGLATGKPRIFTWDNADRILALNWTVDLAKAERVLGYRPEWDMDRGTVDSVAWYRAQGLL